MGIFDVRNSFFQMYELFSSTLVSLPGKRVSGDFTVRAVGGAVQRPQSARNEYAKYFAFARKSNEAVSQPTTREYRS